MSNKQFDASADILNKWSAILDGMVKERNMGISELMALWANIDHMIQGHKDRDAFEEWTARSDVEKA